MISYNQKEFINPNTNKEITIKNIGDLHFSPAFDNKKLPIMTGILKKDNPNYIYIDGDLIDSTNFLHYNEELKEKYIEWIKQISIICPVFICLGSHDFTFVKEDGTHVYDFYIPFWEEINDIPNVHISSFEKKYEDENLLNIMIEPPFEYYYNQTKSEDKNVLIELLKKEKELLKKLPNNKIKTLINHSPIYMTDSDILSYIEEFNYIFSAHMHGGMFPFYLDKIIPGNWGIIAPKKDLFPKNARGIIELNNDQVLIITSGITKFSEVTGTLKYLNFLFPMDIDEIKIKPKEKQLTR